MGWGGVGEQRRTRKIGTLVSLGFPNSLNLVNSPPGFFLSRGTCRTSITLARTLGGREEQKGPMGMGQLGGGDPAPTHVQCPLAYPRKCRVPDCSTRRGCRALVCRLVWSHSQPEFCGKQQTGGNLPQLCKHRQVPPKPDHVAALLAQSGWEGFTRGRKGPRGKASQGGLGASFHGS